MISDKNELENAAKYALVASLENEYHMLYRKVTSLEGASKDVFFAKTRILLVPSKINHFKVDFSENDFFKVCTLLDNIKEDIINV